ncbi:MAG: NAD(P)H-hydrate dehydratase [Pseudomonadota bacterium]|nr:NAD(P)H-hydrate dehydratase [Pseudomonadota bacterium]
MNTIADIDRRALRAHPLPTIEGETDKDSRGRVFIIAGSRVSPGAALLAGVAALRGGAGKALIATSRSLAVGLGLTAPEFGISAMKETSDGEPAAADPQVAAGVKRCDAVLVGPGLMNEANAKALALRVFTVTKVPVVLDAAAVTGFAGAFGAFKRCPVPRILTPHAGEMATLMGSSKAEVVKAPQPAALKMARELKGIVVLKGAVTYVATPTGHLWRHVGGVCGLATAGSGDSLAGLMTALLARGASPLAASLWSVFVHARAGAALTGTVGPVGFLAREIPALFPALLRDLSKSRGRDSA